MSRSGLIDEHGSFVYPTVVGGGTAFFLSVAERVDSELIGTRTFGGAVVCLRYRRV